MSPGSDRHVVAATRLAVQLAGQLDDDGEVVVEGPAGRRSDGMTPFYVPDVAVVWRSALQRRDDDHRLAPPPLVVLEVFSPATRRRDLGDEEADDDPGGASMYWTIELPGPAAVEVPRAPRRARGLDGWKVSGAASMGTVRVAAARPLLDDMPSRNGRPVQR